MKGETLKRIITFVGATIVCLLCVALGFIEMRTLVAGDAILYESPLNQTLRLFFRFLGVALIFVAGILSCVALWKKGTLLAISVTMNAGALVFATISMFFYEWYIALGLIVGILCMVLPIMTDFIRERFFHR